MNLNQLNLALKMIQQDYKLTPLQLETLSRRLMADEREFERMWALYNRRRTGKEDIFLDTLLELLSN
jgi:hypothetical protein